MRQVLRVFPDYTADPVWCSEGMVDLDELSISDRLRRDLREWARDWEDQLGRDSASRSEIATKHGVVTGASSPEILRENWVRR